MGRNNNKKASAPSSKLSAAQIDLVKTLQQDGANIKVSRFTNNSFIDTNQFSMKLNMRTMDVLIDKGLIEFKETTLNHNVYLLTDAGKSIKIPE
jgi:hypothetical protein